jgi:hypothetical protein
MKLFDNFERIFCIELTDIFIDTILFFIENKRNLSRIIRQIQTCSLIPYLPHVCDATFPS